MAEILENCCVICRIKFLEADEKQLLLGKDLTTIPLLVHNKECRKRFTDPRKRVTNEVVKNGKAILRSSSQTPFNWKSQWFLCAEIATVKRHPDVMFIMLQHYHFVKN